MTNNIKRPITLKDNMQKTTPKEKQDTAGLLKILLIIFVLVIFLGVGLAVGIYLKIIDTDKMISDYKVNEAPIIGQFFQKPPSVVTDNADLNESSTQVDTQKSSEQRNTAKAASGAFTNNTPGTLPNKPIDLAVSEKEKQKEEAKRISKLARLYGTMQPEEAVNIFNQLNDESVLLILSKMEDDQVAKILAAFDVKRSARLTQLMMAKKVN